MPTRRCLLAEAAGAAMRTTANAATTALHTDGLPAEGREHPSEPLLQLDLRLPAEHLLRARDVGLADVLDVLERARLEVVDADHAVAACDEVVAETRAEKACAPRHDRGRHESDPTSVLRRGNALHGSFTRAARACVPPVLHVPFERGHGDRAHAESPR